jgi:D-glycero-D-manno-heptose 1,7-bisphosphate phosphatase
MGSLTGVAVHANAEKLTVGDEEAEGDPAVFLDRDGVINRRSITLVRDESQLEILPGVPEAVARLTEAGYRIVIVTNQRPVAWGIIDGEDLDRIHEDIQAAIEEVGGRVDAFRSCRDGFFDECACGKPEPGMLVSAAEELGLASEGSWMVGDKPSDVEAGRRFGADTIKITGSKFPWERWKTAPEADHHARDLPAAVDRILAEQPPTPRTETSSQTVSPRRGS